jgi:hypothetical protein
MPIPAQYFGAKEISVKWNNGLIVIAECRILGRGIFLCYYIIISMFLIPHPLGVGSPLVPSPWGEG